MNIYIMRHGETDWNKARRIQGNTDIPLNENGIELAKFTAQGLHRDGIVFDRAFSSPLSRAVQTAEIICKESHIPVVTDPRITEFAFGQAEGVSVTELTENPAYKNLGYCFTKPSLYRAMNGAESFEEMFARTADFMEHVLKPLELTSRNVLVSCHGGTARALLMNVNGWELDRYWDISEPNCAVNLMTLRNGVFSVVYMGKTYYTVERQGIV